VVAGPQHSQAIPILGTSFVERAKFFDENAGAPIHAANQWLFKEG